MSYNEKTTFKHGNTFGKGRHQGSRNKEQIALQQIGFERAIEITDLQYEAAKNGSEDAQRFLISMFISKPKPGRFINVPIRKVDTINDVLPAQQDAMEYVTNGELTVDEGDKLFEFIEHHRKTIEVMDLVFMIEGIDKRMKSAGI
jgi:hypothetical protein